ncbi:hypothetical protein [Azospirillum rugosum]|nr:hypothetical protein [Azospirillum rugosum]MBP2296612.1 hypothetical protein [Azospirillum rugosum]MDQ0530329.1 hypothetical protein [Azospirillum rugosum]
MGKPMALLTSALLAAAGVQAAGYSAASAANQQVAQAGRPLRLSALCMQDGQIAFFFENNSDATIDHISINVTFHSRKFPNQPLDNHAAQFEYSDPESVNQDSYEIPNRHCSDVDFIRVRDVGYCKVKGVIFPLCRNYLEPDVIEIDGVTP